MQPKAKALRAITTIYITEIIKPVLVTTIIALSILTVITVGLATKFSYWWLLLLVPLVITGIAVAVVALTVTAIAKQTMPTMSSGQSIAALSYVKNMHQVLDAYATPQFIIIFKVVLDIVRKRWQSGFITSTVNGSTRLKSDFDKLAVSFEQ